MTIILAENWRTFFVAVFGFSLLVYDCGCLLLDNNSIRVVMNKWFIVVYVKQGCMKVGLFFQSSSSF